MEKLEYKGFTGSIEYSFADKCWFGVIQDIDDLITYESEKECNLYVSFINAVDDYVETCKRLGKYN